MVLEDRVPDLPVHEPRQKNDRFSVGVISARADDEPFNTILDAAARLPQYEFFITGRIGAMR